MGYKEWLMRHGLNVDELPFSFSSDTSASDDNVIRNKDKRDADMVSPADTRNFDYFSDRSMKGIDQKYRAYEIGDRDKTLPRYLSNGTIGIPNPVSPNKAPYVPGKIASYNSIINVDNPAQTTDGAEIKVIVKPQDTYQLAMVDPSKIISEEEKEKIANENQGKMSPDGLKDYLNKFITADKFYERYYTETDFLNDWETMDEYNRLKDQPINQLKDQPINQLKDQPINQLNQERYNRASARLMRFNEYALKHSMGNIWNIHAGIERGNGTKESMSFSHQKTNETIIYLKADPRRDIHGNLVLDLRRSIYENKISAFYSGAEAILGLTESIDDNMFLGAGKGIAGGLGIKVPTTGGNGFYAGKIAGDLGTAAIGAGQMTVSALEWLKGARLTLNGDVVAGQAISASAVKQMGIGSIIYNRSLSNAANDLNRLFAKNETPGESGQAKEGAGNTANINGKAFEDLLTKKLGGNGSFSKGGRDFDGGVGNRWWEAKSGEYWDLLLSSPSKEGKFYSDMGSRLKIAQENGATYELFSNTPIPQKFKDWLTKKGIKFTEQLE